MGRYEFIEHTADIGVKAYGDSTEETFAVAAEAMFALITDDAQIEAVKTIEFEVVSEDREGLLVKFLSQLIVIHEVENLVLTDFEVKFTDKDRLVARMKGERFDTDRHGGGTHVKGVSYHMLELVETKSDRTGYTQVLFDI